ncbi:universal stress protein [Marinobacterium maritimum]|uniref:Universal stress protein n=1 Tax=Marinobacterium maritimum TaxID=500162 RepID=A0ABN1I4A7_9GAMM
MHNFNKLLVVLNPTSDEQVALNKAIRIAGKMDIQITALLLANQVKGEFRTKLDQRLLQLKTQGIDVKLEISEETDLLRAVLLCQHQHGFDLTLKEPHKASLTDSLFTSVDWKLLRTNRTPVLMVRSVMRGPDAPILAAVEAQPSDQEHLRLSNLILEQSRTLADRLSRPLHLFSAAPAPMQDPAHTEQHTEQQTQAYREACIALGDRYGIPAAQVHVGSGPAELLIADQAKALGAQLLVLGTVARTGLRGVLLGNTAEQVLERADVDVLVIPPTHEA